MNFNLACCLLCLLVESARSEFSSKSGNDLGADTRKPAAQDQKSAEKVFRVNQQGDSRLADDGRKLDSSVGHNVKLVSIEPNYPLTPNEYSWNNENTKETENKNLVTNDIQKHNNYGMRQSIEDLKKRKQQKKYQILKEKPAENSKDQITPNKKDSRGVDTEQSRIKPILTENYKPEIENIQNKNAGQLLSKAGIVKPNTALSNDQVESRDDRSNKLIKKNRNEKIVPLTTEPTLLTNLKDDSENFIDDYNHEEVMKQWKKNLWLENLIPKSNKFLYNNKKYRDHLKRLDVKNKNLERKTQNPDIHQARSKRSVLSSIFVQMPHGEDEESQIAEDTFLNNEESRDKKSKGSTTVCLEIKNDPTKPPSTICGPEIKPHSPFSPHMYSVDTQNYVPNSFYYSEPETDKTLWSMNPLHDPSHYYSSNIYKDQSTNKEHQRHHFLKHDNSDGLKSTSQVAPADNGYLTPSDKRYQSKENSVTQSTVSPQDKSKTLNATPVVTDYLHGDKYDTMERGQSERSMSENNSVKDIDSVGVSRNDFKDLDLNLDAEMSSNTNSYVKPEMRSFHQYDPQQTVGSDFGNDFDSDQSIFYPSSNYDANDGILKVAEQAAQIVGIYTGNQAVMLNKPSVALHSNSAAEMVQNFQEAYNAGDNPKSNELLSDDKSSMGLLKDLNTKDTTKSNNSHQIEAESDLRNSYDYYPDRSYPYRPTMYPYVPPSSYPYHPYQDYIPYDPDCRSGKCRSAEMTDERSSEMLPNGLSPFNALPVQPSLRNGDAETIWVDSYVPPRLHAKSEEGFESVPIGGEFQQFRGNDYYYGRPYPYRPNHEYQDSHSYPYSSRPYSYQTSDYSYSSRPYPYRPSGSSYPYRPSGSSYPYDSNCRTADGRSCRDAETEKNSDVDFSTSVRMQNYIRPHFPILTEASKRDDSNSFNGNYRSMGYLPNPAQTLDPSSLQVGYRTAFNSANPQSNPYSSSGSEFLASLPPHFRTKVPVEPHITPSHAPIGLACNLVHGSGLAHQPSIGLSGYGIGEGHGHPYPLGGIGTHGIALNSGLAGLGTYGFNGLSSGGTNDVFSGVGTHGIGGSHGISHHHLLRENNPLTKEATDAEEELNEEFRTKQNIKEETETKPLNTKPLDTKRKVIVNMKPLSSAEEVKLRIEEKLRSAEEKLHSSKSEILEKINKTTVKERKINEKDENKTDTESNNSESTLAEPQSRSTFFTPTIVQFPTGGKLTYQSGLSNIPMMLGSALMSAPFSASEFNSQTPFGNSLTYGSPFFGYDQPNIRPYPWSYYPSYYPSWKNQGSNSVIVPTPQNFERSMADPLLNNQNSYIPLNAPTVIGSTTTSIDDVKSANIPCLRNSGSEILGSSFNTNVLLPDQKIVSSVPAQMPSYQARVGIAPTLGSIQYQNGLNRFLNSQNVYPSPMVGYASLSEMKASERQLKQNYPVYNNLNQDTTNLNSYELNFKSRPGQSAIFNPTLRSTEENVEVKTGNQKLPSLKKPDLKSLERLSTKVLTSKSLKLPTPLLKLPKPILKSSSLRAIHKEPCALVSSV